jgi:Arm domain-containing DNA-binding protein/integrase-like protein
MAKRGLTDLAIRNLKPSENRREIPDRGGLYVILQPSGRRGFAVRYRFNGEPKKLTLPNGVTLAQARVLAADAMLAVGKGIDPSEAKKTAQAKAAAAAKDTLSAIGAEYYRRDGKSLRSAAVREGILKRLVYPTLGARQIADVKRSEIIRLLDKIEDENGPRQADIVLAVVRRIMNWYAARSDEFRSPIVRGMARCKPKERERSRILNDDELRAVWKAAEAAGTFGALVRFLLLTGARRNEAAKMEDEVDGTGCWTLPASRSKTKVDLARPLSRTAQAILDAQPRIGNCRFAFTNDGKRPIGGFSYLKKEFDKACGVTGWQLHDLRRTARSLLSRAGVASDHAERCLGHAIGGVRGVYDRHRYIEEMRAAFEKLAQQIHRIRKLRQLKRHELLKAAVQARRAARLNVVTPMRRKGQRHA